MLNNPTLKKVIEDCGVHLYDSEIVKENERQIVRIYIHHPEGVTIDQCTKVSQIISPILDLEPPVSGEYMLEVSSPGIERPLKSAEHFQLSVGEKIKATILEDGEKTKIKGTILSVDGDQISVEDKNSKSTKEFSFDQVLKAKTYYPW